MTKKTTSYVRITLRSLRPLNKEDYKKALATATEQAVGSGHHRLVRVLTRVPRPAKPFKPYIDHSKPADFEFRRTFIFA